MTGLYDAAQGGGDPYQQQAYTQQMMQPVGTFPVTTALELPGTVVAQNLGICYGLVVRSMGAGKSLVAGFKSIAGGEIKQYSRLVEDSRRQSIDRMIDNARQMGANAIISMRFDSSEIGQAFTEIVAYGTAVVVVPRQ